jgi:hypothetical protein
MLISRIETTFIFRKIPVIGFIHFLFLNPHQKIEKTERENWFKIEQIDQNGLLEDELAPLGISFDLERRFSVADGSSP